MSWLTYILPVLAAFFVIMIARRWMPAFSDAHLPQNPDTGRVLRPRFTFKARSGRLTRLDAVLCLVITVCYAVVAFTGLGDMTAPQSWCRFTDRGQYAAHRPRRGHRDRHDPLLRRAAHRPVPDAALRRRRGLRDAGALEQGYADLFKWLDYSLAAEGVEDTTARYIRLVSSAELSLGEVGGLRRGGEHARRG